VKALDAGVDQFGGEHCTDALVDLVRAGIVPEERLDASARRLLRDKFRLGLFDNPYVDPARAAEVVGSAGLVESGRIAQRRSIVLLKNGHAHRSDVPLLPLPSTARVYLEGVDPTIAAKYATIVPRRKNADVAILRVPAPYEPRSGSYLEQFFHAGDLRFPPAERERILEIAQSIPTILDVYLDRPAVMPEVVAACAAVIGSFGVEDSAILDVVFGHHRQLGRLPFELPSSMDAVRRQSPDLPDDSERPLFPRGYGLDLPEPPLVP
jgi:beta-glucosidase